MLSKHHLSTASSQHSTHDKHWTDKDVYKAAASFKFEFKTAARTKTLGYEERLKTVTA